MGEVVNAVVALAVIVFIFRWATSSKGEPSPEAQAAQALRFRPKKVTPDMTDTISNMFPDIPRENIHYDLLRTGSVEITSNKIIERGFLDAPPQAYYTFYPRSAAPAPAPGVPPRPGAQSFASSSSSINKPASLIQRFHLEELVSSNDVSINVENVEDAGGRAVWEDTPEKREASLRERKARMVLAARQRLLAQQKAASEAGSSKDKAE